MLSEMMPTIGFESSFSLSVDFDALVLSFRSVTGRSFSSFCPGTVRIWEEPFFWSSNSYVKAKMSRSGLLRTAKSPVFLAKSVTNFRLWLLGEDISKNGFHVVSIRDRAVASLISEMTAATVTKRSALARSDGMGGSFFNMGPASKMIVWIDLEEVIVQQKCGQIGLRRVSVLYLQADISIEDDAFVANDRNKSHGVMRMEKIIIIKSQFSIVKKIL